MITELKQEFQRVAAFFSANFTSKSFAEYEDFAQNFDFSTPSINQTPIVSYTSQIDLGVTKYASKFDLYFLKKFVISDNVEDEKDIIIDEMVDLSEQFQRMLDKNTNLIFSSPNWKWSAKIERQFTANMLCGVRVTIDFETACNRLDPSSFVPSLPITIRNSDGSYSITFESKNSPYVIGDIRYQVGINPVVQIPYTSSLIVISDDCQTLTELWNASSQAEKIALYIALSDADLIALYLALSDSQRLVMYQGISDSQRLVMYQGLIDAQRLTLIEGLTNEQRFDLIGNSTGVAYTYNFDEQYSGQVTSYQTNDDKAVWDAIFTPTIQAYSTTRHIIKPILNPTNEALLLRGATLSGNNVFGNKNVWTDTLGGQTYANGLAINHRMGIMLALAWQNAATWANAITLSDSANIGGYTDWFIPNIMQAMMLMTRRLGSTFTTSLPSLPFTNTVASGNILMHTSSTAQSLSVHNTIIAIGSAGGINTGVLFGSQIKTVTARYLLIRKHF